MVRFALTLVSIAGVAAAADCNTVPATPQTIELPGHPFHTVMSRDGCWIFAAVVGPAGPDDKKNFSGIAVVHRDRGRAAVVRSAPMDPRVFGLALSRDEKAMAAATQRGATLLDPARLISGAGDPVIASIPEEQNSGSIYVAMTRDSGTLFISEEGAPRAITVVDLRRALKGAGAQAIIGRVPTGSAPISLAFSRDEKLLYATSQAARPDWGWEEVCDPENPNAKQPPHKHPEGAVMVIDVAKARIDPANAVVQRVRAGCNPVRLALSPDFARLYVTNRKDNAVRAFDARKLARDPEHALIATVPVGTAPVPVVVANGGRTILAGNSNRFAGGGDGQSLTVIDAAQMKVIGNIAAGVFPRSLQLSPDGRTVVLANFGSATLQLFDAAKLPLR